MPIVQAGKQFTKADLQQTAGTLAALLVDHTQSAHDFAIQLQTWPDADLLELGLTQPDIDAIKGFFVGDLPTIYNALVASTWVKKLIGLGV